MTLRIANKNDLDEINEIIKSAVMSWNLPERVKRLSISSYLYKPFDLEHRAWINEPDNEE